MSYKFSVTYADTCHGMLLLHMINDCICGDILTITNTTYAMEMHTRNIIRDTSLAYAIICYVRRCVGCY